MSSLPATMTAIEIVQPGGPEVLQPKTRPLPLPGPGEVLIKVAAAGVNRPDVGQRSGTYNPPPGASDLPGLEVAGEIVALGTGVTTWALGDKVTALTPGGGYAEYCKTPAPQCLPVPTGLSMVEAAGIPENWFTVWGNMVDRGHLAKGEKFLVHGGTSGIGTAAIQLAKLLGARAFTTAGSAGKCGFCERLGVEAAINYKEADFVAEFKPLIGDGFDVILDMVAGAYTPKNLSLMAPEGRLVFIAQLGGNISEISAMAIMFKRLTITGSTLRPRTVEYKGHLATELHKNVWPALESGAVKVIIDSTMPFTEAAEAHRRLESSQHIGKIMLTF